MLCMLCVHQGWAAYSPVKNSPADARAKVAAGNPSHSATAGELDIYQVNCRCDTCLQTLAHSRVCGEGSQNRAMTAQ